MRQVTGDEPPDEWARPATNIVHWATGIGWGALYGVLASATSPAPWARRSRSVRSPGSPAMSCFPWRRCTSRSGSTTRGRSRDDLSAHLVYGAVASAAFAGLTKRSHATRWSGRSLPIGSKGVVMTTSQTTSIEPQFRTIDGLRIRYADSGGSNGAGGAVDESLAGEHLRVRADVGDARRACPSVRRRPTGVRRVRAPGGSPVSTSDGRVPGPADRRGRPGEAAHRRAGRRDLSRAVRRGGASASGSRA